MNDKNKKVVEKATKKQNTNAISNILKTELRYIVGMYCRLYRTDNTAELINMLTSYSKGEKIANKSDKFFIMQVVSHLKKSGVSVDDILANKDLLMTFEMKQNEGSFFTPLRWARRAHQLIIDKIGLDALKDYHVWDSSCGSGNLLVEFPECKHVWLSTLNGEDIPIVEKRFSTTRHAENFTAFQLDFLSETDTVFHQSFTYSLPDGLRDALLNNEKIAIVINPPYSVRGTNTHLGNYLQSEGLTDFKTDLFRQFIWQVCNLVEMHNLTNVEFVLMVTGSIHITRRSQSAVEKLNSIFNYDGGFLYPASEFEGVSDGFSWAISTTHWSRRGKKKIKPVDKLVLDVLHSSEAEETVVDYDGVELRKDKKIVKTKETEFSKVVQRKIWDWIAEGTPQQKDTVYPRIHSLGTGIINNDIVKGSSDALWYIYGRDTLRDNPKYMTFQTTPIETSDTQIHAENMDKAMFWYAYTMRNKEWSEDAFQRFIAPVENDFYLNEYLPNAYLLASLGRVNMSYATRELPTAIGKVTVGNPTFPFTREEVLSFDLHPEVRKDVEENYWDNSAYLEKIKWAEENASDVMKKSWGIFKELLQRTMETREVDNTQPWTKAYNLCFAQIRKLKSYTLQDEDEYTDAFEKAWSEMRRLNGLLTFAYGDSNASG